jgi:hypothetical protein
MIFQNTGMIRIIVRYCGLCSPSAKKENEVFPMRKGWRVWVFTIIVSLVAGFVPAFADEDANEYSLAKELNYRLYERNFGRFETPMFELEKGVDNLVITPEIEKTAEAIVRSYARFRNEKTGDWSRFVEFEGEFHFAQLEPVNAYQLLFVVLDLGKGQSTIKRFTAQGRTLGEDLMAALSRKPEPFESLRGWTKPAIMARDAWKARSPKSSYTPQQVLKVVLHHSWQPSQVQYKGAATIRGIQNYHMDDPNTGWIDIGYHFLIGPDGVIYQGRPETAVGSHAKPNTNMVGICMIGNYDPNADQLNPAMEKSLVDLLSWLSATYKVDPKTQYYGHRDFSTKSCPGDLVYNRLPEYRQQVLKNIGSAD